MRTTPLDPDLLSTPFKVETNWHVFTGAACTGKTTLIEMLSEEGYRTIPESARPCFEREIAKGRTIAEIRQHGVDLQREIASVQVKNEHQFQANETTFLDRAVPDSLTFFRIFGIDTNEILPQCFYHHYASVFIFDRLPFQRNQPLGPEDAAHSEFLDEWLARDYTALGYRVLRVPVLSPQERLDFILQNLKD